MVLMTPESVQSYLGQARGVLSLAALPPGSPSTGDARLWVPGDLMFAWKLPAGTVAAVGLAAGQAAPVLLSLRQAFQGQLGIQRAPCSSSDGELGDFVVVTELWPAPRLAKGTAAASPVLRDALGRPGPGTQLAVFLLPPGIGAVPEQECSAVSLRLCTMQGGLAPTPALLSPLASDGENEAAAAPASPTPAHGSNRTPVALSPAMRSGSRQPAALSPAMRVGGAGGGATPVGLFGKAAQAPHTPQTPKPAAAASQASSTSGEAGRAASQASSLQGGAILALLQEGGGPASSQLRCLVEQLLLRQLLGRRLLPGNFVAVPVLGQQAVFVVERTTLATPSSAERSAGSGNRLGGGEPAAEESTDRGWSSGSSVPTAPINLHCKVSLLVEGGVGGGPPALPDHLQARPASYAQAAAEAAAVAVGGGTEGAAAVAAFRAATAGAASFGMELAALGGAQGPKHALRELVSMPLRAPHLFSHYGVVPPRGILLYGPPGTGKTVLARAAASAAAAKLFVMNGPDVTSEFFGESEAGLRGVFAAAKTLAPSVVFIDELDALAPSRGGVAGAAARSSGGGGMSGRLVAALLGEMDGLRDSAVVLIAATNRPDAIDPALRRPGRFDREVEVGVPSPAERRDILRKQLEGMHHELTQEQVTHLADAAHGFVPADLAALCNEAGLAALRRVQGQQQQEQTQQGAGGLQPPGAAAAAGLCVTLADFRAAETRVRPSAMREVAVEVPKVRWEDVGGLEEIKQRLKEAVEWPFQNPEALSRLGAQAPKGMLLHGPPGCSKTLLARAVASEAGLNFLAIKGPELYSKYVGESEKAIAKLFARARAASPSVIFLDELDGLATSREEGGDGGVSVGDRVLSQLLQEMDGLQARQNVIVIAATNRLDCIDPALTRPGRFDRLLYISPPDESAREAILAVHTRRMPLSTDVRLHELAARCFGFSGADIMAMCREAALAALEANLACQQVCMRDFEIAFSRMQPSFLSTS